MIVGVVLAAGLSKRFGEKKMMATVADRPLYSYCLTAALASRVDRVVMVVGPDKELQDSVSDLFADAHGLDVLINSDPHCGQTSSLRIALLSLPHDVEAVLVFLADMPLLTSEVVDEIIEQFESNGGLIIPVVRGHAYHPRLLPRKLFDEFLALSDDEQGQLVVRRHEELVSTVEFDAAHIFDDVDTIEDLARVEARINPTD